MGTSHAYSWTKIGVRTDTLNRCTCFRKSRTSHLFLVCISQTMRTINTQFRGMARTRAPVDLALFLFTLFHRSMSSLLFYLSHSRCAVPRTIDPNYIIIFFLVIGFRLISSYYCQCQIQIGHLYRPDLFTFNQHQIIVIENHIKI